MMAVLRVVCLLLLCCVPLTARAQQDGYWTEAEFWARLQETETALKQAHPPGTMLERWHAVRGVRLADGTTIDLDLDWLRQPLERGDPEALTRLQQYMRALLTEYAARAPVRGDGASLSALEAVLRDPRFQYPDITPTSIPVSSFRVPEVSLPTFGAEISQLLLIGIGLIALVIVVVVIARVLQVQPTALNGAEAQTDDPSTASGAVDLASDHAARQDYRNAVRYLYLSSLLWLDERGVLRYNATLTNREHLRQLHDQIQIHDTLRGIVNVFEDVWYGNMSVDEGSYRRFVQQVDALRRMLP